MDTAINMNEAIMDDAIARRWIVANAIVLVASAVCGFAGSGADALRAIQSGDVATATTIAYWTVQIGLMVILCAAYAMLTAPVFRSIIPALRLDLWLATHVAMGVVLGVGMALTFDGADNREAFDWSGVSTAEMAFVVLCAAVAGAIVGAALGGLQSMVWHRVARGSRFWIGMTALSGSIVVLILFAVTPFFPGLSRLGFAVILECAGAVGGIVSTLIMVPALRRLQPRG
jgi:hypothetical protein